MALRLFAVLEAQTNASLCWKLRPRLRRAGRSDQGRFGGRGGGRLGGGVVEGLRGGVEDVEVEAALALGDQDGDDDLARDVGGGADHVEDRVDGQQQADAFEGKAEGAQRQGEHDDGAGEACGRGGADDRDEGDQQVVADAELDVEDLGDEDGGQGRVDGGAAVHHGGGAEGHGEGGVVTVDAHPLDGDALGQREGADGGAGDEGQLDGGPGVAEEGDRADLGDQGEQGR